MEETLSSRYGASSRRQANLSLPLLQLLGELQQYRPYTFVNDQLAEMLELYEDFDIGLQRQLYDLLQRNDPVGNRTLHKIFDFLKEYMVTVQDHTEQKIEETYYPEGYNGFFVKFWEFAKRSVPAAKNYLVQKHLEELVEMIQLDTGKKPGTVHGIGGGATDETIYTFAHLGEAYELRRELGINEGYPVVNPVLPIAPGYLGFYHGGHLTKVFRDRDRDPSVARTREQELLTSNHPDDEYIYDDLNEPLFLSDREQHPSNKLRRLEDIWAFSKHLKSVGRSFFFDLSKINMNELHPMVAANLYSRNQELLHARDGVGNRATALKEEEFVRILFPRRQADPNALYTYRKLTELHMRKKIEDDFGLHLEQLGFWTQRHFLSFLEERTVKDVAALQHFTKQFGTNGIQAFLAMEFGREYGDKILAIGAVLPEADAKKLFAQFAELVDLAQEHAEDIAEEIRQSFPDVAVDGAAVFESLIARARDLLRVIPTDTPAVAASAASRAISGIERETREQSVLKSQFNAVVELLSAKNVDLRTYEAAQQLLLDAAEDPRLRAVFLHTLQAFGRLKPIPEIHWRVDRSTEKQRRRLGVDLTALLYDLKGESPKTVLEIGPGSGVAKRERAQSLGRAVRDYGLSDAIYFPLQLLVEKVLNLALLERALGVKLSGAERSQIAEFVAKTLIIKGSTAVDHIAYDAEVLTLLAEDVNALKSLLPTAVEALSTSSVVPDTMSSRDAMGRVIYLQKVRVYEQTQNVQQAIALLANLGEDALSPDARQRDLYELMDVYPANVIIGDMRGIDRLADAQIDLEIGVRSTVYLKGKDWVQFLATLLTKLTADGIAIDDSVRDNDGWYYRIGELVRLKEQLETKGTSAEIFVITGPGFPGEDTRKDDAPLSVVLAKDPHAVEKIRQHLLPGHTLRRLDELAADEAYLTTLDQTGLTAKMAKQALEFSSKGS